MAKRVQFRRGTNVQHNSFTGALGEVTVDTTLKTLRVHDNVKVGGHIVATQDFVKDSTAYTVEVIEDFITVPVGFNTVIVKDVNRGGTFVSKTSVDIDPNTGSVYAVNGGTVFAKSGGGFWVRQFSGAVNVKWFGVLLKTQIVGNDALMQKAINYCVDTNVPMLDSFRYYQSDTATNVLSLPYNLILINENKTLDVATPILSLERVVFVGNSLTDFVTDTSFTRHLAPKMASFMGGEHKEIGYLSLDSRVKDWKQKRYPYNITKTADIVDFRGISDGNFGDMPYRLSPDGAGMSVDAGVGVTTRIDISGGGSVQFSWNKAKLYYAKQIGGGTFTLAAISGGVIYKTLDVNTNNATNELGIVELSFTEEVDFTISIVYITGKCAFYGVELKTNRLEGLRYDVFARNGIELADFLELDELATQTYYQELNPTVVFLKIGTNDAVTDGTSANDYISMLEQYIARIRALTSTATQIVLINPSQSSLHWSNRTGYKLLREYEEAEHTFCKAKGYGYIDLPAYLGGNAIMYKNNAMLNTLHPNSVGKLLEADAIMRYLEKNTYYNHTEYYSPNIKKFIPKAKFDIVEVANNANMVANVKSELVKYGLVGNNSGLQIAYFDLTLTLGVYNALFVYNIRFQAHKLAISANGTVDQLKAIEIIQISTPNGVVNTINVELISNQIVISVTPVSYAPAGYVIDGKVIAYEPVATIDDVIVRL